jgi:zinc transporter
MVHAYLLDRAGGARALDRAGAAAWGPEDGVLWLHLDYTDPAAASWVGEGLGLDPLVSAALLTEDTRPRVSVHGEGLLVALRGVNLTPGAEPDDMVSVRLWVTPGRVVSTRKRRLLSVADVVAALEEGRGPADAWDLLVALADRIVWRMSDTVDQFEDRVAALEEQVLQEAGSTVRFELAALRRQNITLRRYLAPQREALGRLIGERAGWLHEPGRARLREVQDRLVRHIEDLDAVRERAAVAQEELLSRLSEQMNQRMYVLSLVAAIFLPLGFLTGLLGINVGGIPGADDPWAFLEVVGLLVLVVAGQLALFRWKRWL